MTGAGASYTLASSFDPLPPDILKRLGYLRRSFTSDLKFSYCHKLLAIKNNEMTPTYVCRNTTNCTECGSMYLRGIEAGLKTLMTLYAGSWITHMLVSPQPDGVSIPYVTSALKQVAAGLSNARRRTMQQHGPGPMLYGLHVSRSNINPSPHMHVVFISRKPFNTQKLTKTIRTVAQNVFQDTNCFVKEIGSFLFHQKPKSVITKSVIDAVEVARYVIQGSIESKSITKLKKSFGWAGLPAGQLTVARSFPLAYNCYVTPDRAIAYHPDEYFIEVPTTEFAKLDTYLCGGSSNTASYAADLDRLSLHKIDLE